MPEYNGAFSRQGMSPQEYLAWAMDPERGFQQGIQGMDAEFAIAVAPYLMPEHRKYIDPSAAKVIPMTPAGNKFYPWVGANTMDAPPEQTFTDTVMPWALFGDKYPNPSPERDYGAQKDITLSGGNVYAYGAQNANPFVWAHEFRHNVPGYTGISKMAEVNNRMMDIHMAHTIGTDSDREQARKGWASWMYMRDGVAHSNEEVDAEIDRIVTMMAEEYADLR